jgi:hypothetical protein
MSVAVDETGDNQSAAGIDPFGRGIGSRQVPFGADPGDPPVSIPGHGSMANDVRVALTAFGTTGGELADISEDLH